jgi:hypothetical protein
VGSGFFLFIRLFFFAIHLSAAIERIHFAKRALVVRPARPFAAEPSCLIQLLG